MQTVAQAQDSSSADSDHMSVERLAAETWSPQAPEAEELVLAALLQPIKGDAVVPTIASILTKDDFHSSRNGLIFEAAVRLHERGDPVESVSVVYELERTSLLVTAGGAAPIHGLGGLPAATGNVGHYASIVKRASLSRGLEHAAVSVLAQLRRGLPVGTETVERLRILAERTAEPHDVCGPSPGSSWQPIDLSAAESEPQEPSIGGLLYPGKLHLVSGAPDAGKSWFLLALAAAEMLAGKAVFWLDFDGMGGITVVERLRALGVPNEVLHLRLRYFSPDEPFGTGTARRGIEVLLADLQPSLVVFDAVAGLLQVNGAQPDSESDVEGVFTQVGRFFTTRGAAVVLIDHLVKDPHASPRYPTGSQRKVGACDVHLGVKASASFSRGSSGSSEIRIHRDRLGHHGRDQRWTLDLASDPETFEVTCGLRAHNDTIDSKKKKPDPRRIHEAMQAISEFLARQTAPVSKKTIETEVTGFATDIKRLALNSLADQDYVAIVPEGQASMCRSVRAYDAQTPAPDG